MVGGVCVYLVEFVIIDFVLVVIVLVIGNKLNLGYVGVFFLVVNIFGIKFVEKED